MRREMILIRMILEYVEVEKTNENKLPAPEFPNYQNYVVEHHVMLCGEAGYLEIETKGGKHKRPTAQEVVAILQDIRETQDVVNALKRKQAELGYGL